MITENQQKIISSPATAKLMVKAGPGTGKTFSLIERLKYLVKSEHLEPSEILVLSFSVAAAREIRNRLGEAVVNQESAGELLEITIRTFDSFASAFMFRLNPEIDLADCGYDRRIAMATELINSNENARQWLGRYRHIMVDEVQDLVGVRANLTLSVLYSGGGGFTLFGDPAQAVYNFLMGEDEEGPTSDEFLEQVYQQHDNRITDYCLNDNFRVGENEELKLLADTGRKYLLERPARDAYSFLRNTFADLKPLGCLNDIIVPQYLREKDTAFLCRTNGQALRLARHFQDHGVKFTIRRPLEEKDIPSWIGRVFTAWPSQDVKKKEFLAAISALEDFSLEPGQAWRVLKTACRVRSGSIRMPLLRQTLAEEDITVPGLEELDGSGTVISTIHRAKGREFDNVVLVIPEENNPAQFLDEGRVMFVGLTRARKRLFKMSEKGARGIRKSGNRWIRCNKSGSGQSLTGIEIGCYGDFDAHSPVSNSFFDYDPDEIEENQNFLWEEVCYGTPAILELYGRTGNVPLYQVRVFDGDDYLAVGHTSKSFGYSLQDVIMERQERRPSRWPGRIEDLWVREVVTELGNLGNEDVHRKYRDSGLWLGVRLQGLGTCRAWRKLP